MKRRLYSVSSVKVHEAVECFQGGEARCFMKTLPSLSQNSSAYEDVHALGNCSMKLSTLSGKPLQREEVAHFEANEVHCSVNLLSASKAEEAHSAWRFFLPLGQRVLLHHEVARFQGIEVFCIM
jgi:hypothetical protein